MVNLDYIKKELERFPNCTPADFKKVRLCKKWILWLFTCFDCDEMVENWYDYETSNTKERIKRLTWQEPYFAGNWNMTQVQVNKIAVNTWWRILASPITKGDRLWQAQLSDGSVMVFWYGRDFEGAKIGLRDYAFMYSPKDKTNHNFISIFEDNDNEDIE